MINKKLVSICIPCYNEEENVVPVYKELIKVTNDIKNYNFEFIFVDNGSIDHTKKFIKQLAYKDKRVVGIFLSRNFGPEASGQAAHNSASGDGVISIAGDLQDPPQLIPKFIEEWENGYDIILGTYNKATDNYLITTLRLLFYKIFKIVSNIDISINVTGFGLMDKKVLLALRSLPEKYRFGRGLLSWVGFKKKYLSYNKRKRLKGKSSYGLVDYIKASERGLFGFSYLILDLIIYFGLILVAFSFIFVVIYLFAVLFVRNPLNASIPLLLTNVFFSGIQLLAISIVGKYIQVIVEETKARPTYIIDETVNFKKKQNEKM